MRTDLQIAVGHLLQAIDDEDAQRAFCESVGGAALFLALGGLNKATELRIGWGQHVRRLLDNPATPSSSNQGAGNA